MRVRVLQLEPSSSGMRSQPGLPQAKTQSLGVLAMQTQDTQGDMKSTLLWTAGAIAIVVALAVYVSM